MLLGALMVLAPGVGAEDGDGDGPLSPVHDVVHNADLNDNQRGTTFASMLGNSSSTCPAPTGDQGRFAWHFVAQANADFTQLNVDFASAGVTIDIVRVADPDASHAYVYTATADTLNDATATVDPAPAEGRTKFQLSHVCEFADEGESADLTVVKLVDEVPAPETAFDFLFQPGDGQVAFDLAHGESEDFSGLTPGSYTVRELDEAGFDLQEIECVTGYGTEGEEVFAGAVESGADVTVTLADGDDVTCVYTNEEETPNIPPPPPVPTPEADLRIVKVVEGAAPDGWTATFVGVPGDELASFQLGEGDETEAFLDIAPGTYRVEEVGSIDSELTGIDCVGAGTWEEDGDAVEVTLVDGDDLTCTFTNLYPEEQVLPQEEEPGSITIVKAVQGPVPTDGWAFGFDVSDGFGQVILTNADADETFNSVKAGQYTITEHDNSATTLGSIACDDPDAVSNGRTVTVDVSEGEDVTCTFTNVFPPVAQTSTEVKGDVVTRTLPRTGDETRNLAGVGAFMLALGAAMVLGSKRQLASR